MWLNNISAVYDFRSLPCLPLQVTLALGDIGGDENFQVNGGSVYVGELEMVVPSSPAPDVTFSINTQTIFGGTKEVITLTGPIETILLGGQELWVDNICARCDSSGTADVESGSPASSEEGPRITRVRPGPGGARTLIEYDLPDGAPVSLAVFDVQGALVRRLVDGYQEAGSHSVWWDGRGGQDRPVAEGVYFVRLDTDGQRAGRKLLLVR